MKLEKTVHREQEVILLKAGYDTELNRLIRQLPGRRWSQTQKSWYVPYQQDVPARVLQLLGDKVILELRGFEPGEATALPAQKHCVRQQLAPAEPEHMEKIRHLESWMRSKRYSESTVSTYTEALGIFFRFFAGRKVEEISNQDLIDFNNQYILANHFSSSYQNQVVNAVKLFFSTVEQRRLDPMLVHRPKRAKLLPNVLSKEEVRAIIGGVRNLKHRAMLSLTYACGLRCGELLRLRPDHIDTKRGLLIVKQAKGRKDRVVPLGEKITELLREYYVAFKPREYLFEGQTRGTMYDERSLQQVLKQSVARAGIGKPVTLHWLRHSYATHLLENGTDLRYIQEILGHTSSRTTEIYTHVSNHHIRKIVSPFDHL